MTVPSQDALMKELAGAAGGELIDPLELDPALTNDPLETKPVAAPSATAALNAEHSTKAGGKGFAVTVQGEYYAPAQDAPGKKIKKPYKVTINLPSLDSALSIIKNKLINAAIKRAYPESLGERTCEIVSAIPLSPSTQESNHLQFMNRPRLERYVVDHGVPLKPEDYDDVVVLRNAVIDFTLNPKGFEAREAAKQADRKIEAELAEMNPGLAAEAA